MTTEKIQRIEFIDPSDKRDRQVIVTMTDGTKAVIYAMDGHCELKRIHPVYNGRCLNLMQVVSGFLLGNGPGELSYMYQHFTRETFFYDLAVDARGMDGELYTEKLKDFYRKMCSFRTWEAA